MLDFFLDFEKKNLYFPLHFEAKIEDFFSIMFLIFFNIILSFQIPVIVYILNYKKIINNFFIIKNRKIFYLFFLLLSALMAPPEIISQLIIYIFILILFEIFILMILFIKNIIV
jgi:sec-independent protein translocase protein TatC